MPSASDEYEKLKRLAQDQLREKGKVDPKVMHDKAAAKLEVRNEQRAKSKAGFTSEHKVRDRKTGKPKTVTTHAPSKKSLQDEYVRKLPEEDQDEVRRRLK